VTAIPPCLPPGDPIHVHLFCLIALIILDGDYRPLDQMRSVRVSYISVAVFALNCEEERGSKMSRLLPIAAVALLACSAVQARPDDTSNVTPKAPFGEAHSGQVTPVLHSAPEFHAAAAVAALTLLLGGVAVLKGWRHE
jgi:hypothetical protein